MPGSYCSAVSGAQLVSVRVLFWATLSAPLWIAGIFGSANFGLAMWTIAVAIDYAGGALDFPTPRLGRAGLRGQKVAGAHLVERYQQVLIIAFGETILSSGIEFTPFAFQRERTAALIVCFIITLLLVRIYIFRAGALLPEAIAATNAPAYVGELASYAHLVMAAGIILAVAVPLARHLPSIGVAAITVAVLGAIATGNYVAVRRNPRAPLPPRAPAEQSPR